MILRIESLSSRRHRLMVEDCDPHYMPFETCFSPLSLLMLGIFANHAHYPRALDDFALAADFPNR
jgi:hypothetical protein